MKNKKAAFLMGETAVKLVIAILSVLILIALLATLYSSFIKTGLGDKPNVEVKSIYEELQKLNSQTSGPIKYTVLYTPGWYLTSSTQRAVCGESAFCLCICKSEDCQQKSQDEVEVACTPTQKFVSISGGYQGYRYDTTTPEETREVRGITLKEAPSELTLFYLDEKVYPRTEPKREDGQSDSLPPTFYQFKEEWKWTLDLENWMDTSGTEVAEGVFKFGSWIFETHFQVDYERYSDNIATIKLLNKYKTDEEEGKNFLERITSESNGVYRIEV